MKTKGDSGHSLFLKEHTQGPNLMRFLKVRFLVQKVPLHWSLIADYCTLDYAQVDVLGFRRRFAKFTADKSLVAPNFFLSYLSLSLSLFSLSLSLSLSPPLSLSLFLSRSL